MLAPFSFMGGGIDPQALEHYNRVIDDLGMVPAGLLGTNAWFKAVKGVYGTSDITTSISAGYDPHYLGVKSTLEGYASKLYSCSGASGDLVQETDASMPLLLVKNASDANYWFGSGVAGNYCSTTTSKTFTNFTLNTKFNINTQLAAASEIFGMDFVVRMNLAKTLDIYSSDAVISVTTTAFAYTDNTDFYIRITRVGTTLKVFSSTDGINYTQKDSDFTVGSGSITITNLNVAGFGASGAAFNPFGRIYYATIDGVVDFNPASYNAATSQTSWVSATSETWTINKSSGNTFVGVLVDRTLIQGNNTTTSMSVIIAGTQPYTEYLTATKNGVGTYVSRATGNARGHSGTNLTLANGTTLNFASTATTRQTMTYRNNGAGSGIAVNNGTETTGNAGANNGTTLVLAEGAHNITTFISSLAEDSAPQRAAMYTAVKSFNNY